MNDAARMPETYPGPVGNPQVIAFLEEVLAKARAGEVHSVAVVMACGPGMVKAGATPGLPFELYFGLDDMKAALHAQLKQPAGKPSILMPGRRM